MASLLLSGVGEVEGLDGQLVEIGALGAVVLRDEDGVGGDGLVEGAGEWCRRCGEHRTSETLVRSTGMRLEV